MRVFVTLFALAILINSIDLSEPYKEAAIFPAPLELYNVDRYESCVPPHPRFSLYDDIYLVGTDKNYEYVIGLVLRRHLCAFLAPLAKFPNPYVRVKVRIGANNNASEIVRILDEDPVNSMFHKSFNQMQTHTAIVHLLR